MKDARPTFLSLFAGIGGIDLGLERAGWRCVGQVEIDPFCRRVLAKHWPDVPRFEDVRTVTRESITEQVDLIAGGFPCQDISNAGKRAGIDGERSGLWSEFYRLVCEIRPRFVLVENVAALLNRGIDRVLGDLAASGFDAEWDVLAAADFGAPHIRERVFILADSNANEHEVSSPSLRWSAAADVSGNAYQGVRTRLNVQHKQGASRFEAGRYWWAAEPSMDRVAYGVPAGVDRIGALGNAVVPQVAEWIGRRILKSEGKPDVLRAHGHLPSGEDDQEGTNGQAGRVHSCAQSSGMHARAGHNGDEHFRGVGWQDAGGRRVADNSASQQAEAVTPTQIAAPPVVSPRKNQAGELGFEVSKSLTSQNLDAEPHKAIKADISESKRESAQSFAALDVPNADLANGPESHPNPRALPSPPASLSEGGRA